MIPHARQIFYASAPDKHYRMLLQVMPHPRNIGVDLVAVGEPHARNLAKRRVGFLGRRSLHLGADPAFLRATLQRRRAYLVTLLHARASYQLINRGHDYFFSCKARCCVAPVCKLFSGPFPLLKQTPQGRLSPLGELSPLTGIVAFCQSPAGAWAAAGSAFSNSSSAGKPSTRVSIRLYLGRPVPAGIRRPIITFSLSPTSRSTLPFIAASVSTRVVSWNEAAEMKLSVESEALVIPSNSGSAIAGSPPLVKTPLLGLVADQEIGVAHFLDPHPPEHLAHDHLDVLVVDTHALEPVNLLDFVDQVFRQGLLAQDRQDVVRIRRTLHQRLARLDHVPFVHADMLTLGDQVLARLAHLRRDHDLALALSVLAERNLAVNFRNDGELLRLACLEQLCDPRQAARDILRLRGFARNLGDNVARIHLRTFRDVDVCADRQEITRVVFGTGDLRGLAGLVLDRNTRADVEFLGLDDDIRMGTGALIDPLFHRLTFKNVAVLDSAANLRDDRRGVRIPFGDKLARLDPIALGPAQLRAIDERITFAFTFARWST